MTVIRWKKHIIKWITPNKKCESSGLGGKNGEKIFFIHSWHIVCTKKIFGQKSTVYRAFFLSKGVSASVMFHRYFLATDEYRTLPNAIPRVQKQKKSRFGKEFQKVFSVSIYKKENPKPIVEQTVGFFQFPGKIFIKFWGR